MKRLRLFILLLFVSAAGVSAQTAGNFSSSELSVSVIEQKWRFEVRNPALDDDPFRANNELRQAQIDRNSNKRQNDERVKMGLPQQQPAGSGVVGSSAGTLSRYYANYIYETKIKNDGPKEIKAIWWDYIFIDPTTKQEVGRLNFTSESNVRAGEMKTLKKRSPFPPTKTIDARQAEKNTGERYDEKIMIRQIDYKDGTVWKSPSN